MCLAQCCRGVHSSRWMHAAATLRQGHAALLKCRRHSGCVNHATVISKPAKHMTCAQLKSLLYLQTTRQAWVVLLLRRAVHWPWCCSSGCRPALTGCCCQQMAQTAQSSSSSKGWKVSWQHCRRQSNIHADVLIFSCCQLYMLVVCGMLVALPTRPGFPM